MSCGRVGGAGSRFGGAGVEVVVASTLRVQETGETPAARHVGRGCAAQGSQLRGARAGSSSGLVILQNKIKVPVSLVILFLGDPLVSSGWCAPLI